MSGHTRTNRFVRLVYVYSRVLGMCPLDYDFEKQDLQLNGHNMRYNICVNILVLAILPLVLLISQEVRAVFAGLQLPQLVAGGVIGIRYATLAVSLAQNYAEQFTLMRCYRRFRRLHFSMSRELQQSFEFDIVRKILTTQLSDLFSLLLLLAIMKRRVDTGVLLALVLIFWLTTLPDVIMLHYYFYVTSLNLQISLWQAQFERLLEVGDGDGELRAFQVRRIARSYSGLQQLLLRINSVYMAQGGCCLLTMYASNMALFYLIYTFLKYGENVLALTTSDLCLLFCACLSYYGDISIFSNAIFESVRLTTLPGIVLQQYIDRQTLCEDAARQLHLFKFQLLCKPFVLQMYGLFSFHKRMAFSFLTASTLNAIVLMQIDYERNSSP